MIPEIVIAVTDASSELIAGAIGGITGSGLGFMVIRWLMSKHDQDMRDVKAGLSDVVEAVTALILGLKSFENSPHLHEEAKKILAEREKRKDRDKKE